MSSLPNNNHHTTPSPVHSGSSNKSKSKSKSDLLRAAVGLLLKQKKFVGSEKFRKSDFLLLQGKNNFAVQKMLESDLHSSNCFTYSNVQCITNNQHMVDQQFGRFIQFVDSQPESLRVELKRFLAPMLCHLYLELLKAREPKGAVDFLKKYAHIVAPVDLYDAPLPTKINGCSVPNDATTHATQATGGTGGDVVTGTITLPGAGVSHATIRFAREAQDTGDVELDYFMKLVQILSSCTKLETAEQDATVSHFRASKYELHTTAAVVEVLFTFLEKRGHVLILSLLSTWIHVHVVDNEVPQFSEDHIFFGGTALELEDAECLEGDFSSSSGLFNISNKREQKPNVVELNNSTAAMPTATKRAAAEPTIKLEADIKSEPDGGGGDESTSRAPSSDTCLLNMRLSSAQILKSQNECPRFIKLADRGNGLTSAHLDADECHLVAGYDMSSVVQLWQLNQQRCSGKNFYRRFPESLCRWDINNWHDEEEKDEVEEDFLGRGLEQSEDEEDDKMNCTATDRRRRRKAYASKYDGNSFNEFGGIQLRGHSQGVTDVRFSAHHPLIYSVSKDTTMRSWRSHNYNCAAVYRGHYYPIWCMDESPTGMYLATGSRDLSARLWSLERDYALIVYAGHTQDVESLAFHPNGSYIATGSADHSVRLWCVTSGKLMRVFPDCKQSVTSLAFSPDGKMLAAGGEESKVRIFDLAAGAQLCEFKDHTASVTSLAWSRSDPHLATVCNDGTVRIWDAKKLSPMSENSSTGTSSSSSSSTTNRLISLNSSCQRLIKVCYSRSKMLYCIGT